MFQRVPEIRTVPTQGVIVATNEPFPMDFVVGMRLPGWQRTQFSHEIGNIGKFLIPRQRIELPPEKAERLATAFGQLVIRRPRISYNCLSLINLVEGFKDTLETDEQCHYKTANETTDPCRLMPGTSYIIGDNPSSVQPNIVHAVLATSPTHVIHITGPQGRLAYGPAADLPKVWPGDMQQIVGPRQ